MISITMVKTEMQERVKEKAAENVEERILDILIPPLNSKGLGFDRANTGNNTSEITTATLEDNPPSTGTELNQQKLREKMLQESKCGQTKK